MSTCPDSVTLPIRGHLLLLVQQLSSNRRLLPRLFAAALVAALNCLCPPSLWAALPAPKPWMQRSFGNGQTIAVFDHSKGALVDWWLRPYAAVAPGQPTVDRLHDAYFGLATIDAAGKQGLGVWAPQMALAQPGPGWLAWQPTAGADDNVFGYAGNSGVVRERRHFQGQAGVSLTTQVFAPMASPGRCLVLLATVHNDSGTAVSLKLPLLLNFHMGAGAPQPVALGEELAVSAGDVITEGGPPPGEPLTVRDLDGLPAASATQNEFSASAAPANYYAPFQQGQPPTTGATGKVLKGDDLVGSLVFSVSVAKGAQATRGALLCVGDAKFTAIATDVWLAGRLPTALLADELAWWQSWHSKTKAPPLFNALEQLLFQRQLTVLKMAQSQQGNFGPAGSGQTPFGQIPASLPPGQWHITWPRDQSYAGVALAASGHFAEARAALEFVLRGKAGGFTKEVGAPYQVSVTRYFGGGLEESDVNADGPNIELDGFGLVLWQAARYMQAAHDFDFLAAWWPTLRDLVGAPLVQAVDSTGLIQPDSSIWEVHWNGQQKHFAYTSVAAVRGLCGAARLATLAGEGTLAQQYRKAAQQLRDNIVAKLAPNAAWLRGNLEEPPAQAHDLAAVEAFTDGQIASYGPVAAASWQAWTTALLAGGGPGFVRNDDGGWYDSQEWLFIDLRVLVWLHKAVALGAPWQVWRDQLRARVLAIARAGGGLVPELIATTGPEAGQFAGATPMLGFGAGALVLALAGAATASEAWADDLKDCLGPPASQPQPVDPGAEPLPESPPEPAAEPPPEANFAEVPDSQDLSDQLPNLELTGTPDSTPDVASTIADAAPNRSNDGCAAASGRPARGPGAAAALAPLLAAALTCAGRRGARRAAMRRS